MAYHGPQMCYAGIKAGADLSAAANQYLFVKFSADRTVVKCAAATDLPCGVLQNTPGDGEEATVCFMGQTKVQGGADLDFDDQIGTADDGQAVAYTVASTGNFIVGRIVQGNSAAAGLATAVIDCAAPRLLA